jgi:hypothetical protein
VVKRSHVLLFLLAALAFAAWVNAEQERRGCIPCSPAVGAVCALEDLQSDRVQPTFLSR